MEQKLFKKTLSKTITAVAILAVGLSSCKKNIETRVVRNVKTFSTKQEAKAYVNQKLNEYGKIIAKLAVNPEMKKLVNNRVAEKFDGDYNVLLKDLVENNSSDRLALKSNLQMSTTPMPSGPAQQVDLQALEIALTEPLVVNGETLYPQIYIPFFEEQEHPEGPIEPGDPGTPLPPDPCLNAVINPLEPVYLNPVIVVSDGEEIPGLETFTGYTYDENGALIENIPVDECFAKRHRVWAVTFNERINNDGNTPPINSGPTPPTTSTVKINAKIDQMTIKTDKEMWFKGANDVYIMYSYSWPDGINPATGQYSHTPMILAWGDNAVSAISLGSYTNRDIKKQRHLAINKTYAVFGRPDTFYTGEFNSMRDKYPSKGTMIYYAIFEFDSFTDYIEDIPVSYTTSGFPSTIPLIITSYNSPYITGNIHITPNSAVPFLYTTEHINQENDQIKFNGSNAH